MDTFRIPKLRDAGLWKTQTPMIVSLNGWPGVGKLTVGLALSEVLQARLLDNHSLFNVAIALTDFGTPEYYAAARAVRDIAFRYARDLPAGTPLILTNVIASGGPSGFAEEHWKAVCDLAHDRGAPLASITLVCDVAEHAERVAAPERLLNKKMRDAAQIARIMASRALFDEGADYRTSFDTTAIPAGVCAERIATWLWEQTGGATP